MDPHESDFELRSASIREVHVVLARCRRARPHQLALDVPISAGFDRQLNRVHLLIPIRKRFRPTAHRSRSRSSLPTEVR